MKKHAKYAKSSRSRFSQSTGRCSQNAPAKRKAREAPSKKGLSLPPGRANWSGSHGILPTGLFRHSQKAPRRSNDQNFREATLAKLKIIKGSLEEILPSYEKLRSVCVQVRDAKRSIG